MGVSIWLVPRKDYADKLRNLKYWGEDGPVLEDGVVEFDPHITIIGFGNLATIEEVEKMLRMKRKRPSGQEDLKAKPIEGLWVDFAEIATDDHFYRAEVLRIVYDDQMKRLQDFFTDTLNLAAVWPTCSYHGMRARHYDEWMAWTKKYRKDIKEESKKRLFPHVSLMYLGKNDLNEEKQKAVKRKLEDQLRKEEGFFGNRCLFDRIMIVDCPDTELEDKGKDGTRKLASWEAQRCQWKTMELAKIDGLAEALGMEELEN